MNPDLQPRPRPRLLAGQLMLALHRSGRPAGSPTHYRRPRRRIRTEATARAPTAVLRTGP
ncbi:hypothetical protein [Streptomyces sp. NPDC056244]|uniref:hypothetical protein n=1 Tax=Streptomyces sp. NPDC056244 TaxID=3345762 RepID=UPI0035D6A9F7